MKQGAQVRGITGVTASGDFYCPQCRSTGPYQQKRVRRFFTLYFIPVFPTENLGEYIECQRCRGTFKPGVLEFRAPPTKEELTTSYAEHLSLLLARCAALKGHAPNGEAMQIQEEIKRATGIQASEAMLASGRTTTLEPKDIAAKLAPMLTDAAKESVFAAAYRTLGPNGSGRDPVLESIGAGLGLTGAHITGLLATLQPPRPQ